MDPVEIPVNRRPSEDTQPLSRPTTVNQIEHARVREEPGLVETRNRSNLFLFQYVTMLLSGLVLLVLVGLAGSSLLDHWLGEANEVPVFNDFVYSFHVYLLISLVLFSGLHIWMRVLTGKVDEEEQPPSARTFLAIFLTILAVTMVGAFGAIAYIGVDTLLGTGDYSAKGAWLIILDALLVIVWSALLWWNFRRSLASMAIPYVAAVGLVSVVFTILLVIFPVLTKRDAVIDSRTTNDLTAITSSIGEYAQKNNKLPGTLKDLKLDEKVAARAGSYEYQITKSPVQETSPTYPEEDYLYGSSRSATLSYKLCADFKTDTAKTDEDKSIIPLFYSPSELSRHPSGRHCFDRTAYGGAAGDGADSSPGVTQPAEPADFLKLNSDTTY